jgi:serine protease Do
MIKRTLVLFAIAAVSSVAATAQNTAPRPEGSARALAFSFEGSGGYLGVQTVEVTRENIGKFGLSEVRGIAVEKVMENSPAAAAGIAAGDVITKINGEPITSTRKLTRLISEISPDHQARVTVLRGGREIDITATVGKRPAPAFEQGSMSIPPIPPMPPSPGLEGLQGLFGAEGDRVFRLPEGGPNSMTIVAGRQIGVSVYPLTKQLGQRFGVDGGVMVSNVSENSPAARAGIVAGDIIVEVDGKAVTNNLDVVRSINEKKDGDVTLTIVSNGNRRNVNVTPEKGKGEFIYQFERSVTAPAGSPRPASIVLNGKDM